MISKSQIKFINSLQQKKQRKKHLKFVVEGLKSIQEFVKEGFSISVVYVLENTNLTSAYRVETISPEEMKLITGFVSPTDALAVINMPRTDGSVFKIENKILPVLDTIQDPGNMGAIIRICDWYGISQLVCSHGCVDVYMPKVIQASMGSLARVQVRYLDLEEFFESNKIPVLAAMVSDGENLHSIKNENSCLLLIGNEGNGISENLVPFITRKVSIPKFGKAESLNAAIATGILVDNLKREME